jgi:hypothetical protein
MQAIARAGVEFHGSAMRYAEIEQADSDFRLLRLGDCQFEFDAYDVLFKDGPAAFVETVSQAIEEVFEGSAASEFRIAVHPPVVKSFLSSFPVDSSETNTREQLVFESALLDIERDVSGMRSSELVVTADDPVHRRVHVAHLTSNVHARVSAVFSAAGWKDYQIISSSEASARLTQKLSTDSHGADATYLSLGIFNDYSLYTIVKNGEWIFDQVRPETDPTDVAYFAMHALAMADVSISDLTLVSHFGTQDLYTASGVLNSVFEAPVHVMNPIETVGLRGNAFEKDFAQTAFSVCIGAAF